MAEAVVNSYRIASHPELYEPARSNCFEFQINPQLNDLLFAGLDLDAGLTDDDYLRNVQDIIKISVVETSVPHFSIDPIEVRRGNSKVLFAGLPSFDAGSLKLHDFVGARTKDALMAWQALAYDVVEDRVHLASNYKYDCELVEWNPDMTEKIRSWTLKGCWISSISESEFSVENNDKRTIDATLQFDRAIPVIEREIKETTNA